MKLKIFHLKKFGLTIFVETYFLMNYHIYDKEHIHLLVSCPSSIGPSKLVQYLKGRSSRLLQDQFLELQKKY